MRISVNCDTEILGKCESRTAFAIYSFAGLKPTDGGEYCKLSGYRRSALFWSRLQNPAKHHSRLNFPCRPGLAMSFLMSIAAPIVASLIQTRRNTLWYSKHMEHYMRKRLSDLLQKLNIARKQWESKEEKRDLLFMSRLHVFLQPQYLHPPSI